jgi:protein phosphatase 1G
LIVIILSCLSPLLSLLQYLSAPVTDKVTLSGNTDAIDYGISSHQGWRRTQEDAHFAVELSAHCHLFGVFDGHGGPEVAKFCSSNLPAELQKMDCFAAGDFPASLRQVFHRMDALMRTDHGREQLESLRQKPVMRFEDRKDDENDEGEEEVAFDFLRRVMALQRKIEHVGTGLSTTSDDSDDATIATARPTSVEDEVQAGCTAVVALLRQNQLYVANAGDSRAVLSRNGNALALSQDHKPGHVEERERIVKAGGFLSEIGGITRVNGNLNLSRAIGDLRYKNNAELHPAAQIITAEPDIEHISLQSEDRFLILACDGIWDVMSK